MLFKRRVLENIEDTEEFYSAINRESLTKSLSEDRPYTYWTIELYDQKTGFVAAVGSGFSRQIRAVLPKR